jgi:hypothetical protein
MRVVSSSPVHPWVARMGCRWEKRLGSHWYSLLHRHHATRVHRASALALMIASSIRSCRGINRLSRSTTMVIGLSTWVAWLIIHTCWASLTSYGRPYHRLTVLDWSVLVLIVNWATCSSLVLSILWRLLLIPIPLSILSWLWCHMSALELLGLLLLLPWTELIASLLPIASLSNMSQLRH